LGAIDIGPGATDRVAYQAGGDTGVNIGNPANGSGSLASMELWFNTDGSGVKCGTFSGADRYFTSRDVEVIGDVTSGSKQTFSGLDCAVGTGDYLGVYWDSGRLERDNLGQDGWYYIDGDQFGQGEVYYPNAYKSGACSIYATGETGVEPIDETYIDGIDLADNLLLEVRKIIADGFDMGDPLLMEVRKIIADGYALTDTLIAAKMMARVLTDGIALADTLVKRVEAVITDGIAFTDIAQRFFDRVLTDGIAFADCLTRWRWLTAIRNLTRRRCNLDAVRNQDSIDDGNI